MVASSPRPPSASLIVRSLSKPQGTAHDSWNANLASSRAEVQICRRFCILGAADVLLAMQKVEGSNPISRSHKSPAFAGRARGGRGALHRDRSGMRRTQAPDGGTAASRPVSSPSSSRCLTGIGARIAMPRSPLRTQRPSRRQALKPAMAVGVKPRQAASCAISSVLWGYRFAWSALATLPSRQSSPRQGGGSQC
jgi:hypothetical protein